MEFPDIKEFEWYIKNIFSGETIVKDSCTLYEDISNEFKTPGEFLNQLDYKRHEHKIVVFLCLKLSIKPNCNIQSLIIMNSIKIIEYYRLMPEEVKKKYKSLISLRNYQDGRFCSQVIKALIYLEKQKLENITYRDIIKLKNKDFNTITPQGISFLSKFEKIARLINPQGFKCEFPDIKEFEHYAQNIFHSKNPLSGLRALYSKVIMNFSSPEEFLQQQNFIYREDMFVAFLCLHLRIRPQYSIQKIRINNYIEIINYFNLVPQEFWETYEKEVKGRERRKTKFLGQVIKALIYLRKSNIKEVTYEDILKLRDKEFFSGVAENERFPTIFEKVLGIMNGKALPHKLQIFTTKELDYGTQNEKSKEIIRKYLEKNYLSKNYNIDSPIGSIRAFFKWIHKRYKEISDLGEFNSNHWLDYKDYIISNQAYEERTKQVKLDLVAMFFEWVQRESIIHNRIVEIHERYIPRENPRPRMFKEREYHKQILQEILLFKPLDEKETLFKMYMLIVSATGLRAQEVLWLGPDCLIDITDNSAEISLQITEKINVKNKITSVLLWGIEPLQYLQKRFEDLDQKIRETLVFFISI